nr:hypothetical protein [Tanacetum cinerariifolium]
MESLRTHDSSLPISSKIDSLLDEFACELTLLKSIPSGIDEIECDFKEEIRLIEKLLYDISSPRPLEEFISVNSDAEIESFSPSPILVKEKQEKDNIESKPDKNGKRVNTPRSDEDRLELMELTVFLLPKVKSLVRNLDSLTKFYMYPCFLQLMIRKQVGKGFSEVETPLFESKLVEQQVNKEGDADENDEEEVNAGDAAEGDVSAAHGEVSSVSEEPSIPSPTPPTPPPQPSQDIPLTSQVQPTPPQSPQVQLPSPQPQPQQDARIPMNLLQDLMDTYTTLTRRVEHLKFDKVAQALEITKLKRRVKKLERRNKVRVLKLRRLQRVGTAQRVETSDETVLDDVSNQGRMIAEMDQDIDVVLEDDKEVVEDYKEVADAVKDVEESSQDQGRIAEIYKIGLDHANKVLSMQEDETELAKVQEVVDVVTIVKLITKVVTTASETITAASAIITAAEAQVLAAITAVTLTAAPARVTVGPSRRRKGVVLRILKKSLLHPQSFLLKPNPRIRAELSKNNDWDEAIDHVKKKAKEDPATKEQVEEDEKRALKRLNETPSERAAKRQKLDEEVEELKRHLQIVPNEDDDVYTEATPLARKHLEALCSLVKEIFSTINPKNFSDDFLLVTLGVMFKKPDIHAQIWKTQRNIHGPAKIWKTQRNIHGPAKVRGWKLLESCGMQIITFTSTQLILLVERKYPLTRFTLDQMLNAVRLEVEEESEVSLEL